MEKPVIIIGAKGIAKVALDIFHNIDVLIYCLLDRDETIHNQEIQGISVLGSPLNDGYLKYIGQKCDVFVAIENNVDRYDMVEMILEKRKTVPVNAIHSKAYISPYAHLGHGNLFSTNSVVNAGSKVAGYCIVGASAVIDYDAEVDEYANIGAGAIINPGAKVGEQALIGSGAIVASGVKIGKKAQIAPGSLVIQDVPDGKTVFGVPAK